MSPRDDTDELLAENGQDELWLVSYADLLTLLLGFFVLIIAGSAAKPAKFEAMAASIANAAPSPLAQLRVQVDDLAKRANLAGKVVTREDEDGLGIEFKDAVLFDSGSADIRQDGRRIVADVANLLKSLPNRQLVIEGHTDDIPIHTPRFDSNWELSSQRAINVLAALESSGIPRDRLSVRAWADTRPLEPGTPTPHRRSANRRVVIRVE